MKKIYTFLLATALLGGFSACNDFLEYTPTAVIDEDYAFSQPEEMCTAAYSMLSNCNDSYPYASNWPYGDVASDDCLKGGSGTNDIGNYHIVETWSNLTSTLGSLDEIWYRLYCAISRCNRAMLSLEQYGNEVLGEETTRQRMAEMHFLRGHFYFKLLTMFRQIPWIDENVEREGTHQQIRNDEFTYQELFGKVIDDFKAAYDVLPEQQTQESGLARVNKVAAAAYLAKCYLNLAWGDGYESTTGVDHINSEYMEQVVIYTDDMVNSQYDYLEDFGDIFLPEYKNSKESVFAVQTSTREDDGTTYGLANWCITLNGCWRMWSCGWDFHKPSQNLVNAFKTENGLPMFEHFNDSIDYPVNGQPTAQKWDPRLFHTVGMPTFPYKYDEEYTMTMENSRTPNTYGYYASLKEVPQRSAGDNYIGDRQVFATTIYVFRYTDVMLMRAEALVELNRLDEARDIINDIRNRAANSVTKHISYAADQCDIKPYPASYFQTKETARECVRWERRLEMAMEYERYFDLHRWGIASKTLNAFFETEKNVVFPGVDKHGNPLPGARLQDSGEYEGTYTQPYATYYKDAHYTPGKNEFFPVPYNQLYYIPGLYVQNKNYD